MEVGMHSILIWMVAIFMASFAVVVYLGGGTRSSRAFAHGVLWFSLWAGATGFLVSPGYMTYGTFLVPLTYVLGSIIASVFFIFFNIFPGDKKIPRKIIVLVIVFVFVFIYLYFATGLMLDGFIYAPELTIWKWHVKPASILFDIYFFSIFCFGILKLYGSYIKEYDVGLKRNLKYMFLTFVVGTVPPSLFDILFLRFGLFDFYWWGPITGFIWVTIVGYSMLKYQQMKVKLLFSEIFIIAMVAISIMNIFVDVSLGIYGKIALPILLCIFGYFLIKSVLRESNQTEELIALNARLGDLNKNLEQKVSSQTLEIRHSLEVEKKARIELQKLDQNKSDFIIVTQHHLRTPLAKILWYTDSVLSGLYGDVSKDLSDVIVNIGKASEKLIKTLNNFLDISQLKIGVKILSVSEVDLRGVIEQLILEFSEVIGDKKISVNIASGDVDMWQKVAVDPERTKDAFSIIIDNAIQYNIKGGTIEIFAKKVKRKLVVSFLNTGIVLSAEDKERVFKESFFRTKEAKRVNPLGMGVGLLVARTIITMCGGKIVLGGFDNKVRVDVTFPISVKN